MEIQSAYQGLLSQIKDTYTSGKVSAIKVARRQMVQTYWAIGRHIVEFEQAGYEKAVYGSKILERLSKDLSHQLGRGFDRSTLIYMRLCFLTYPNIDDLSHQLTWSHYLELLKIDNELERIASHLPSTARADLQPLLVWISNPSRTFGKSPDLRIALV